MRTQKLKNCGPSSSSSRLFNICKTIIVHSPNWWVKRVRTMTRMWEDVMAHKLWGEQLCEHIIWTKEENRQSRQKMAQNSSNGERASTLLIHCYWSNEEVLIVILLKVISTERDSLSKNFSARRHCCCSLSTLHRQQSPKMLQFFPWKLFVLFFFLLFSSPPSLWLLGKYVPA